MKTLGNILLIGAVLPFIYVYVVCLLFVDWMRE